MVDDECAGRIAVAIDWTAEEDRTRSDRDLHLALNAGIPIADPSAGSSLCSWPASPRSGNMTATER
jgi:hypothetical protein